jgi:hypothetical protein
MPRIPTPPQTLDADVYRSPFPSRNNQQCESITIRNVAGSGGAALAAQTMISCVDTAALFDTPNTLWRETFSITTPVETVTATRIDTTKQVTTATATETRGGGDNNDDDSAAMGRADGGAALGMLGIGLLGALAILVM